MDFRAIIKEKIKTAPKTPGVYVFREKKEILYIGKASNLRSRLKSYLKSGDFKNDRLHEHATSLEFIELRSEIEALIEEAKLIKKYNPPYNVIWRDDKTYFYAAFTKEKFPRISVVHKNALNSKFYILHSDFIGPFTEGRALRLVLKMLRRYFPYCTCAKPHFRVCLNAQIGNCFGFCCQKGAEATKEQIKAYKKNIDVIKKFLLGKPLKGFSKNLKPEEKLALEKILAHREFLETLTDTDYAQTNTDKYAKSPYESVSSPYKSVLVEGFDISHLSGKETVAGMTAWNFSDGVIFPRKDFWRKFIIRTAKPSDDPAAMFEAVSRRLNHPEWPYPDLMIIDGGAGQFAAAKRAFQKSAAATEKIKLISFAKPEQMIYGLAAKLVPLAEADEKMKKIIPHVVSKTHDYAVSFHRQRRKKNFLDVVKLEK